MKPWIFLICMFATCHLVAQNDTVKIHDAGDKMVLQLGDSVVTVSYETLYITYLEKGVEKAQNGEFEAAISDFDLATLYLNTDAQLYFNRGLAYYNLHRYENALRDFNVAIGLDSSYSEAYNQRAITKCLQGFYVESLPDFQKAIDLRPEEGMNYHNKAVAHLQLGEIEVACALLKKALSLGYASSEALIQEYCD